MKILLVEDDMEISAMLKSFLMTENYEVITASDGESACEKFFSDDFSLVLLDLMIPKRNGMEVMGKIRESSTVPIIIISAKDTDSDKTLGLGLGADDYITKPFSVTEVLARIKANIRRTTQYAAGTSMQHRVLTKGALIMDLNAYSVKKDGKEIELNQAGLITYSHGAYFELGKKVGSFGYSVRKPGKKSRNQKRTGV